MASSYLVTIPKADVKLKKVSDFTTGIFIDTSGSTSSQLVNIRSSVLRAELSICKATRFDHTVLWNTSAQLCTNLKSVTAGGGTDPKAIFQNESTSKAFQQSDVIVFVTDGEIDGKSVTEYATYTKDNLNKALIICIIVNKKVESPSQINVSVVAPLMMASNVLCLFYDGELFYILSSKGSIGHFYPSSADLTSYKTLNTLNINELFHQIQINEYTKIPDGYISIHEDDKEIVAIDFNQFLNTTDFTSIMTLTERDWKPLIQYGKIGNKLHELRRFVSHMKNQSIEAEKETIKARFHFVYSKQRDELITKIVTCKLKELEQSDQLDQLRQELSQISDQAKLEEIEYLKYTNLHLHQTRQYWNHIQSLIHEQETGSYSINDFTFSSNRANRAKLLPTTNDEEHSNLLDHTNVPLFECAICMEQGPFVLWLTEPTDLERTTNDFIINFPLEGNSQLSNCLVANPVCGFCAKSYITASMNTSNQLITLYREPCSGFIPLNWSVKTNRQFANRALYRILTGNRILQHVQMLLLAMIDDHRASWLTDEIREYFLKQIIENIFTTDSFSEEGTRMVFVNALKEIIKQEEKLFRQPFRAVCRILDFNHRFHRLNRETLERILRKRFALMCIEIQCTKTKFGPEHLVMVKEDLYDILFQTLCGIPLQNSFQKVDVTDDKFQAFIGPSYQTAMNAVDKLAANIGTDRSKVFPPTMISFILYLLSTVEIHDRPMKLYTDFVLKHSAFRNSMQVEWSKLTNEVNSKVFGNYHYITNPTAVSYAINLGQYSGPSKFFFHKKPLWSKSMENQHVNIDILITEMKRNLDEHLKNLYGNAIPDKTSGHILLHRIVADVIENDYPMEETLTEPMIMDCMIRIARTAGRKGNIYAEHIFSLVVLAITDYLKFRRRTKNMLDQSNETRAQSYRYKVQVELVASGMEYSEESGVVFFEPSKFDIPEVLDMKQSDIKFNDWKKRVQELYIHSRENSKKNTSTDQTCLNIEIKDFIEFGYKMSADDLLASWAKEQQTIVSSIVTDSDQIEQPIKYLAGLDISFVKTNEKAVASMVIFDYSTMNIVAKISVNCNMKIPYIAGYLAFREAPVFMKLIDIQKEQCPHLTPQVILMDGNGVWHPRRVGIASHFGVLCGIPCFGVSKNVLYADGITREKIEELLTEKAPNEDQYVEVRGESGYLLGLAYNVTGFIKNAVYISVGHQITLETACRIFKTVTKYRVCEPIRQADLLSREMVTKLT